MIYPGSVTDLTLVGEGGTRGKGSRGRERVLCAVYVPKPRGEGTVPGIEGKYLSMHGQCSSPGPSAKRNQAQHVLDINS